MAPKPVADDSQVQRITIVLRNICRDYPAGGGILRELLQNADDAGATVVRFVLDERIHPTENLIDPVLAKYQGPALLAYNDGVFTKRDWDSLRRLGDSLKFNDGLTTGKFGRGFSSVYNWTDSPSIVSGDCLLIQDPHEEWTPRIGASRFDFVASAGDAQTQNHMAAFQALLPNPHQRLEGTIIRIPLRTKSQAEKSDISSRETTVSEVKDVLQKFAGEFGNSGLLFMRSVEQLGIEVSGATSVNIEMVDRENLRSHKSKIKDAVKNALNSPGYSFHHSFEAQIEHRSGDVSSQTRFMVHHSIQCTMEDRHLQQWAQEQKSVPWVAVAAQISHTRAFKGSLFTVLPLPIASFQPVHVHGLFSLSPDRARLHQLNAAIQYQEPAKWNQWLFQVSIPLAWTKLLTSLSQTHPDKSPFDWWPQELTEPGSLLTNAVDDVLKIIDQGSLPLWPTDIGYVDASVGLLCTIDPSAALKDALREAQVPVIYVPKPLQRKVQHLFKNRSLSPQNLCIFLKTRVSRMERWSLSTKQNVLEFLVSEPEFVGYSTLELFPFQDGKYRAIVDSTAFVPRNKLEVDLFSRNGSQTIDLTKLTVSTQDTLREGCRTSTLHPSIRHRSVSDFKDYCLYTIFRNIQASQDNVVLSGEQIEFITKAWEWISTQRIDILDDAISGLWLLPLTNGTYRKFKSTSPVILAATGEFGDLMWKFDAKSTSNHLPLLNTKSSACSSLPWSLLKQAMKTDLDLRIRDGADIVHFTEWLCGVGPVVNVASVEEKELLVKLLALSLGESTSRKSCKSISKSLLGLELFQKVSWKSEDGKSTPDSSWTSINASRSSFGLLDGLSAIPPIPNIQFLLAPSSSYAQLLIKRLDLTDCGDTVLIIEKHVIPALKDGQDRTWTYSCKEQVASLLLRQYSNLSGEAQRALAILPFVPVAHINGAKTSNFAAAAMLIDPTIPELKALFFEDEACLPSPQFFSQFRVALKECGLKSAVDEALVESRIRVYAFGGRPFSDVKERANNLLDSTYRSSFWAGGSELRKLNWLPVTVPQGSWTLCAPDKCRGLSSKSLVSFQLPIFDRPISEEWQKRLGWQDTLPNPVLIAQLTEGLKREDREVVDAVLKYIADNGQTAILASQLMRLPCILTSNGRFVSPSKAFAPPDNHLNGCERLHPYLDNVDKKFWADHAKLMAELRIGIFPNPKDLLIVQNILELKLPLSTADMAVAVEILNLASRFSRDSLVGLKVPNKDGCFCSIRDISYDDSLGELTPKELVNLTHPDIPLQTIKRLGIEFLRDRLVKGMLDIVDIDDDEEFDQKEQVTTRIADTLERYPVNSTFREYLANADDAKASKVNWLLDERQHPCKDLLTKELKKYQGPALLVHNDSVFNEADFEGFKNVGEGSKRQDKGAIGQFGRGSQTMFHWTDVPAILSGRFLIILDPQRQLLPKSRINGKHKAGVKIELSKLKSVCPDHLAPFDGLWDYAKDLESYPGTIFRFPLRAGDSNSKLTSLAQDSPTVVDLMSKYFDEARISLLFLRQILSIDFKIHGKPKSGWSVGRLELPSLYDPFFSVKCSFTNEMSSDTLVNGKDEWWVAIKDLHKITKEFPYSPKRVMKNVECGVAALVPSKFDSSTRKMAPPPVLDPRIFSTLPLPISSDLPVHIHATFSLSGDRRSLGMGEYGTDLNGSEWNKYLLGNALPNLYLSFLSQLGIRTQVDVFDFWPQISPPPKSHSEIVCSNFWKELPAFKQPLFPEASLDPISSRRQLPEPLSLERAIFDFLPKSQSDTLLPLLLSLDLPMARQIPKRVADHLKKMPDIKRIEGPVLRALFKSPESKSKLEKEMVKNPLVLQTLLELAIPVGKSLEDLDSCYFLPLASGKLGVFRLLSFPEKNTTYYMVSEDERKLFDFASALLVAPEYGKLFKGILDIGTFNIVQLNLQHVKTLLTMRRAPVAVNPTETNWLKAFWKFWNSSPEVESQAFDESGVDIDEFVVCQASCDGSEFYLTPSSLEILPAVVKPALDAHQSLSGKFPGLYQFNSGFLPKAVRGREISLYTPTAFDRLMRALRLLAGKQNTDLGAFLTNHLDLDNLKELQSLVIYHCHRNFEPNDPAAQGISNLKPHLRTIPLWPSCNPDSTNLISASTLLMVENGSLLVPWMTHYSRFVDPKFAKDPRNEQCLKNLGVDKVSVGALLSFYILPLPKMSSDLQKHYQPLIEVISQVYALEGLQNNVAILRQAQIAVDRHHVPRNAADLFDHEDQVFVAAFRGQSDGKFLHDCVQSFRTFWLKIGLRHRQSGYLKPGDYLHCLRAMARRLTAENFVTNLQLQDDNRTVLSPLTTPSSCTDRFDHGDWSIISSEKVFTSRNNWDSVPEEYRRGFMTSIAINKPLLCLSEVISYEHAPVCWSQTPFPFRMPTREVLSKTTRKGQPPVEMVWRHLDHLRDMSQNLSQPELKSFLLDVQRTYAYLQTRLEESKRTFNLGQKAVWLNMTVVDGSFSTLDEVRRSWCGIKDLVLSTSYDAGARIKAVRASLIRYETLLRGLGCNSITYPTVTRPTLHQGHSVLASLRHLRAQGDMLDITYKSEGKIIRAHQLVLAAMSEKCKAQFNKQKWAAESVIEFEEAKDGPCFLSYHTLSTMIKYAYGDKINWSEMEVSGDDDDGARDEKLNLLLDLHDGANQWLIPALKSQVEDKILVAGRLFINIENVEAVRIRAESVNAREVEKMCAEFTEVNRETFERANI